MKQENLTRVNWQWQSKKWWLALIAYWLVGTVGAGIIAAGGGSPSNESGFIILLMVVFLIFAACTDRGWKVPLRITWVIGAWVLEAILSGVIALTIGSVLFASRPELFDRGVTLLAAFPLVVWALRRSTFFVRKVNVTGEVK